jgi:FdhE protein
MMAQAGSTQFDPISIGDVAKPPFARLPDPEKMFRRRSERLRLLADGHQLRPYLTFLADICDAQHSIQADLPEAERPAADAAARARQLKMPPLDSAFLGRDAAMGVTSERLFALARDIAMPDDARAALDNLRTTDPAAVAAMAAAVLANAMPVDAVAEHIFVAAALQVHFARLAAQLDAEGLAPLGQGVCPACGSPPVSSVVVGWSGAANTRFCACSLCGTLWNYPRVKCVLCGATEGISYQEIAGGGGGIKAEACGHCHGYLKLLQQNSNPSLDPVADDVATLALDLLLRQSGFRRGGINPFLAGY